MRSLERGISASLSFPRQVLGFQSRFSLMSFFEAGAACAARQASQEASLDEELLLADPMALRKGLISTLALAVPFYTVVGVIIWWLW